MKKKNNILNLFLNVIILIMISIFAYTVTPKTFQNDTFYTIKIGEHIENTTEKITDLLPWNKGLDMKDPFSWHEGLPYTYPHWLYDLTTYQVYKIGGFQGIYYVTCALAIILGIILYLINLKYSKNKCIAFLTTIGVLFCLKSFIAARAQLVTYILFLLTIFSIEQFLKTKKVRYAIYLIIISTIIANVHCAVWPFFFVLFLPTIVEFFIYKMISLNYLNFIEKIKLKLKYLNKKISKSDYITQKEVYNNLQKEHKEKIDNKLKKTNKLRISGEKGAKWLILVMIICAFTGLLTPIKDTPYTYLIKTNEGNTTQNINEHLPLTLINNDNMIVILIIIFGVLIFSKVKISVRDFFLLFGLIAMSFISQRQVSLLVVIGSFVFVKLLSEVFSNFKKHLDNFSNISEKNRKLIEIILVLSIACIVLILSADAYIDKADSEYVDENSYPVEAAEWINEVLIPEVGIENLKLYNEYNYGSYLLFKGIPVFIDSRADLYTPEFFGEKDEYGNYIGNDIFSDYLDISSLATSYQVQFEKYGVTHVMTTSNSKLNSIIRKDSNYNLLYEDENFVIYEMKNYDD